MSYNKEALAEKARELGVIRDTFEKVLRLTFENQEILGRIKNHPMARWKAMKNKSYKSPLD